MASYEKLAGAKTPKGLREDGPWGGNGGIEWIDGIHAGIKQIIIYTADVIDSIQVEYAVEGEAYGLWSSKYGGSGGNRRKINFQYPKEVLTAIEGYHGDFAGTRVIKSLTFHTNRAEYGPYGVAQGFHFSSSPGNIVGFYGRFGTFLNAIGIYTLRRKTSQRSRIATQIAPKGFHKDGPWGGNGGSEWTDGTHTGIKQIILYTGDVIDSIQVEYALEGESSNFSVPSSKHGGSGGIKKTINFQYPSEILTHIEGYYGNFYGMMVIKSLTFHTNRAQYGPYGVAEGIHFSSPPTGGKIVGFYGRAGTYLDAIGIYTFGGKRRSKSWWKIPSV